MTGDVDYRVLVPGEAEGALMVLGEPLSLWGGLDPETGLIIDRNHPSLGAMMTGRVVVMPHGRGSSSSSSILAEAMRLGTAPAAFILDQADGIIVVGSLVGTRLYGVSCPVLCGPAPGPDGSRWGISETGVTWLEEGSEWER